MSIFVIIIIAVFLFVGTILLVIGLRGRIADDHPYCRKCRFDLYERWPDVAQCPECGTKLGEGMIRDGRRVRGRGKIITGSAMFAFVGLFAGTMFTSAYERLAPQKPQWLLVLDLQHGSQTLASAAVSELATRLQNNDLDVGTIEALTHSLLDIQADRGRQWLPAYGDMIETARTNNRLTDALWQQYVEQGVHVPVTTRNVVRKGYRVPIQFDLSPVRFGSAGGYPVRISQPEFVATGATYELSNRGYMGTTVRTNNNPGSTMTTAFPQDLPIGAHTIDVAMQISVDIDGTTTSFIRRERVDIGIRAGDDPIVHMNDLEYWSENVANAIRIDKFGVQNAQKPNVQGSFDFTGLPIDVAFEVVMVDGDREWRFPFGVTGRVNKPAGYGVYSNLEDLEGDETFDATAVDVRLEPSAEVAEGTVDMLSIWGRPVVIEDVPVVWEFDPDATDQDETSAGDGR